jgi:hypothetical protein
MFYWLLDKTLVAYIYSTLTFLVLCLLFKKVRQNRSSFLNISNIVALIGLTINLCLVGLESFLCRLQQLEHLSKVKTEGYDFYNTRNCFEVFIWTFIFSFLAQLPFLYKRHRQKIWLTIISIFSLLIGFNLEKVVIFITNLNRDYSPSSWSVYYDTTDRIWTIVFSILNFVFCWTIPILTKQKTKE